LDLGLTMSPGMPRVRKCQSLSIRSSRLFFASSLEVVGLMKRDWTLSDSRWRHRERILATRQDGFSATTDTEPEPWQSWDHEKVKHLSGLLEVPSEVALGQRALLLRLALDVHGAKDVTCVSGGE